MKALKKRDADEDRCFTFKLNTTFTNVQLLRKDLFAFMLELIGCIFLDQLYKCL